MSFSKYPEAKVYLAIHEAGHAVCARMLGCRVDRISIRPNGDDDGTCDYGAPLKSYSDDTILLGGLAACVMYDERYGVLPSKIEAHADQSRADMLMTKTPVEDAYNKARKLLSNNWDGLERVAMAVLKSRFGIIVGSEIDSALEPDP